MMVAQRRMWSQILKEEAGLCGRCKKPRGPGRQENILCAACAEKNNAREHKRKMAGVARGLCYGCAAVRESHLRRCNACLARQKAYRIRRKKQADALRSA